MRIKPLSLLLVAVCILAVIPLVWMWANGQDLAHPYRQYPVQVTRDVAYGSEDRRQRLDIYMPKDGKRERPAILWIHGGAWQKDDTFPLFGRWCQYWSGEKGYVCFNVRYRLAPDYKYPEPVKDIFLAIDFVRSNAHEYGIDLDRIVIAGASAGGHLALLAALADPETFSFPKGDGVIVRGAIGFCAPTDLSDIGSSRGVYQGPLRALWARGVIADFMGQASAGEYRKASPIAHVSEDDPPVLLVHGTADRTVPISQSRKLHRAMKASGVPCTLVELSGAGHCEGLQKPGNRRTVAAMQDYLTGIGCD